MAVKDRAPRETTAGCILFDWGDTLMRVFPEQEGKMADWARVEAMPGAAEALMVLRRRWLLALATNADASDEQDIRRALSRVELNGFIDSVYCFRRFGVRKPSPAFFAAVLADLKMNAGRVYMVGDQFEADIEGAARCGIQGVWINWGSREDRCGPMFCTVGSLAELPAALDKLRPA